MSSDWYGFYLQDQIELPFHFHLLAGFRYDDATAEQTEIIPDFGLDSATQVEDDAVNPRVGLLWRPIPALSFYGHYVENFGASNEFLLTADGDPPPAETAQEWEVGVKTELLDGRLSGTLAWFNLT